MTRKFDGTELLIATHNVGKAKEFQNLLGEKITIKTAVDFDLPDVEETGTTYAANARLKAIAGAKHAGIPAIGDDSGVQFDALDGKPGLYTARYIKGVGSPQIAFDTLQKELGDNPNRSIRFICALCLAWPDGHVEDVYEEVVGTFTYPPRGENGFGFDPVFMRDGDDKTFGQLDAATKNQRSHRGQAIRSMLKKCFS